MDNLKALRSSDSVRSMIQRVVLGSLYLGLLAVLLSVSLFAPLVGELPGSDGIATGSSPNPTVPRLIEADQRES